MEGEEKASRLAFGSLPRDIPFVYSAFNQLYKVEPGIWDTWMDGAPPRPAPLPCLPPSHTCPPPCLLPSPACPPTPHAAVSRSCFQPPPCRCLLPAATMRPAAAHARHRRLRCRRPGFRPPANCAGSVCRQLPALHPKGMPLMARSCRLSCVAAASRAGRAGLVGSKSGGQ